MMARARLLLAHWPALVAFVLAGAASALPSLVAAAPFVPPLPYTPLVLDGLGAFFMVLTLLATGTALLRGARPALVVPVAALLLVAYTADPLPLTALALGAASLLAAYRASSRPTVVLVVVGQTLALLTLAVLLREAGSWRLTHPLVGAGLDTVVFVLALSAALLGVALYTPRADMLPVAALLLAPAWSYPLARLYTLGPWNNGWHVALLILSGALALWSATSALHAPDREARPLLLRSWLAVGLLLLGLGSSAGLAAWAYGLLAYLLVGGLLCVAPRAGANTHAWPRWSLSGVVPLSAPFVAIWLGLTACVASAAPAAALLVWLVGLLYGLTFALRLRDVTVPRVVGLLSIAGGVLSPLLIARLVVPLVARLQGGLSPFGELTVWPWLGLAMFNSARREVAGLPSVIIVALLAVLIAIVYLLARLVGSPVVDTNDEAPVAANNASLWEQLRREVWWLGGAARRE